MAYSSQMLGDFFNPTTEMFAFLIVGFTVGLIVGFYVSRRFPRSRLDASFETYVQTLTHELKSPLTAIRGAAELLNDSPTETERKLFLDHILTESERIRKIVDDLLDLTALEAGPSNFSKETLLLQDIVDDVILSVVPTMRTKGLRLDRVGFDVPLTVQGDRFLLTHTIRNLLQNAIDFSLDGGLIKISIHSVKGHAQLTIEDEGPGIPDYAIPRLFERFFSLPRPLTGKKSSGIGLSFVKEAMSRHKGSVKIENRNGKSNPGSKSPSSGTRATLNF